MAAPLSQLLNVYSDPIKSNLRRLVFSKLVCALLLMVAAAELGAAAAVDDPDAEVELERGMTI